MGGRGTRYIAIENGKKSNANAGIYSALCTKNRLKKVKSLVVLPIVKSREKWYNISSKGRGKATSTDTKKSTLKGLKKMKVCELKKMLENLNPDAVVILADELGNCGELIAVDGNPVDVIVDNGETPCVVLYGENA